MQTYIKQNNDHTRIVRNLPFRSFFNILSYQNICTYWRRRKCLTQHLHMFFWHSNILCTFTLRHLPKKYKTFTLFVFFSILEFLTLSHISLFLQLGYFGCINFLKFLKISTVREGMYIFLFPSPKRCLIYA